ncbi:MAG: FAD-binding oxidoreductase [Winogradskyella sp.]|uniref:NAD(P)/FAD-dependent oxidoreductase n=1 Tax=Winogradskyella sp. TaxID=1883156 RepID=UPI0025CF7047|nr:FAD-binding oxidoreductase [Winogradskyella sp.]NRB82581.1 FAD-binding oxidoreductase [Winogradskyella sp.]
MKAVDFIVVGCGLASISFCEQLRQNNHSFIVFDDTSQKSSLVAAGLYNPVILKRFSEVWKAKEQLEIAQALYKRIEDHLNIKIDHELQLLRRFTSVEEQNMWFDASDKPKLEPYLSLTLLKNSNAHIDAPFGFGEVLKAGRLDTETLIDEYKSFLRAKGCLIDTTFSYNLLQLDESMVNYENLSTKNVVFAEGFGIKQNPYFKSLPLNGTKGEVLTIRSKALKLTQAIKSSVFVIPLGNDLYTVGSTYNWRDKSNRPTQTGEEELTTKLKSFVKCDFEVIEHLAGIRPTVKDRRPLVGRHPEFSNLYVLNGLGTRGVMIAPYVAQELYNYIQHNKPLDPEIDINRFTF